ncbi:glycerophosphodiester phosphodiesterase [Sphaerotilaceae bacterium SBD11-9]
MTTPVRSRHRLDRLRDFAGGPDLFQVAHRGARAYAPENTLPAFEKAAQMGCHMVELDVHLSADGHLVVHHDDDLRRCTDATLRYPGRASYAVSDFTAAEMATLDAGGWYLQQLALPPAQRQAFLRELTPAEQAAFVTEGHERLYGSGAVKLPSLEAVLKLADSVRLLVNIEIKTIPRMYPGIAAKVMECVLRHGMMERVLISSFDHEQLDSVRRLNPKVATAVLTSDRLCHVARYLDALDADAFHPGCYGDFDSLGFGSVGGTLETRGIDEARAAGKDVNVWTCNDEAQMRALIDAGVTGLITDYPNRLSAVLRA